MWQQKDFFIPLRCEFEVASIHTVWGKKCFHYRAVPFQRTIITVRFVSFAVFHGGTVWFCLVYCSVSFGLVSFLLLCQQRSSTREWLAIWGLCSLLKIAYQDFSLLWGGSLEHESAPGKRKVHQRAWLSPAKKSGTWTERNGTVKEPNETLYFFDAYCTYCFDHGSFPESYF